MAQFQYTDLLPVAKHEPEFRLITTEGLSTREIDGVEFLHVEPEVLRTVAYEAIHDISHYLRPAHLAQLRSLAAQARPLVPQLVEQQRQKFLERWRDAMALSDEISNEYKALSELQAKTAKPVK